MYTQLLVERAQNTDLNYDSTPAKCSLLYLLRQIHINRTPQLLHAVMMQPPYSPLTIEATFFK